MRNIERTAVPKVTIVTDCVPKDKEQYKANLRHFYDVCNSIKELRAIPECWYTDEEIEELKNNPKKREEMRITFI